MTKIVSESEGDAENVDRTEVKAINESHVRQSANLCFFSIFRFSTH